MIHTPTGESCPACGSRQTRVVFQGSDRLYQTTSKEYAVAECSGCRLLRLHPWPSREELKTYYPESYWFDHGSSTAGELEELYRRTVLRDHVSFIRQAVTGGEPGPVLDVGCGGGLLPRLLRGHGIEAMGLDFSSKAASIAWGLNGVPVVCGDLTSAPFAPGSFKAITMFHVLEHLYDPASYLQSAHALLRPGGKLIVQVPNAASWQFLLFGEKWNGLDIPRHLINFRARDLTALLGDCGYETLNQKNFSLRDNPAGLATTLAPSLDPMARRVRSISEGNGERLAKDAVYLMLVLLALPFTLLEAACGAGSTVMIEARRK